MTPREILDSARVVAIDLINRLDDCETGGDKHYRAETMIASFANQCVEKATKDLSEKLAKAEARCLKHEGHEHCVTPCDSIRIQQENHSAYIEQKDRAEKAEVLAAEYKRDLEIAFRVVDNHKAEAVNAVRIGCDNITRAEKAEAMIAEQDEHKKNLHANLAAAIKAKDNAEARIAELGNAEAGIKELVANLMMWKESAIDSGNWVVTLRAALAERDRQVERIRTAASCLLQALDSIDGKSPAKSCPFERRALKSVLPAPSSKPEACYCIEIGKRHCEGKDRGRDCPHPKPEADWCPGKEAGHWCDAHGACLDCGKKRKPEVEGK